MAPCDGVLISSPFAEAVVILSTSSESFSASNDPPIEAALRRLASACAASGATFKPLPDERFDTAHEAFERSSTQQGEIRACLRRLIAAARRPGQTLRVLSVGPGNGMLDLPLIESLADAAAPLAYAGVDPNELACGRFVEGFQASETPGVSLSVEPRGVDDFSDEGAMDFIHAVHSLYYVPDPAGTLCRLLDRLRPGGRLVVFKAPRGELNALAECFWRGDSGRRVWFSDRLEAWLTEGGRRFEKLTIEGRLDVTRALDPDDALGRRVLDFVLHTDSTAIDGPTLQHAIECLRAMSERDGDRWFAPHPVDAFVVSAE